MVRILARFVAGIARSNLGLQTDVLEHLQLILASLKDIGQPFIEVRTLVQIIRVKKILNIDPSSDIHRVYDILKYCETKANPEIINNAFLKYKKSIQNQMRD